MAPNKETLLIVDDEPPIRQLLQRWLSQEGYRCLTAENGQEALDRLDDQRVDLLLTDINMPVMTGIELISTARRSQRDLAIIMVTAVDDREIAMKALELGAFGYVLKPFERLEVLLHVTNALRLRALEMEHRRHHHGLVELFLERTRALKESYTRLEQMDIHLRRSEQLAGLGQLTAGIAHELNTPVAFVGGNCRHLEKYVGRLQDYTAELEQLIENSCDDNGRQAAHALRGAFKIDFIAGDTASLFAEIREGIDRITELVHGVKDFSRLERPAKVEACINDIIDKALAISHNELKYKATVTREYGAIPPCRCFPRQLGQVFMNILVNAAQAIEKRGEITIATGEEAGIIRVAVTDTGCGIPEELLPRIFEPFFSSKEEGTGLGLAISRDIVREHGGAIEADSRPGSGTTITVLLPRDPEDGPAS
ncbi:MAG: response regulator [Thermodesulfobacteriota bacterium]